MDAGRNPTAEGVPGILNPDRLEQAGVPGAVVDLEGDGVEEARARGRRWGRRWAGDPCLSSHRVDADPLRRRLSQPVDHRVDDPSPRLRGRLRRTFCSYARATLCEPYHFHLTACLVNVGLRTGETICPMKGENGMAAQEVDVLVVGAGPAGLTAAATLARYGAVVQVVERKQRLSTHPRATVVSTRSMELLRSWGLEDEIKAGGMPEVEWLARS